MAALLGLSMPRGLQECVAVRGSLLQGVAGCGIRCCSVMRGVPVCGRVLQGIAYGVAV